MEETKQRGWKEFIRLILKSKLPWHLYIIAVVVMLGSATVALMLPKYIETIFAGEIFDNKLVTEYLLLVALSGVVLSLGTLCLALASPKAMRNIQKTVWSKIMRMPIKEYNKQTSQQLISRITVDPVYFNDIMSNFQNTLVSTYSLVGSYIIMYNMNAKLTIALLPVIPYILIVAVVAGHFTQKTQGAVQSQFASVTAFFAERLPRMRLIKSFNKEEYEEAYGKKVLLEQYAAEKKRAFVDLFALPLMRSTQALIVGIVLIYGAILIANKELKVSQLLAFYIYVQAIHMHVLNYGLFWQTIKQAKGATDKIAVILDTESEDLTRELPMTNSENNDITLENISFSYGEQNVLSDINFTIPHGKVTAIIGPSGCGKSTIFKLLERFYEPNVGRILLGGVPAEKINLDEWRKSIAYVSQASPLLSGTIRDNITYGLDYEASILELRLAAQLADALEFIEEFPDGFDTEVGEFGSKLSGGQRQRIAIARAFILDAPILLLDEATASLDIQSETAIENSLNELMQGRTTLMIAHDMDLIKDADQIIVLDSGTVFGSGTHDELIKSNELYRILVDIETEKGSRM